MPSPPANLQHLRHGASHVLPQKVGQSNRGTALFSDAKAGGKRQKSEPRREDECQGWKEARRRRSLRRRSLSRGSRPGESRGFRRRYPAARVWSLSTLVAAPAPVTGLISTANAASRRSVEPLDPRQHRAPCDRPDLRRQRPHGRTRRQWAQGPARPHVRAPVPFSHNRALRGRATWPKSGMG